MDQHPPYCLCDNHQLLSCDCSSRANFKIWSSFGCSFMLKPNQRCMLGQCCSTAAVQHLQLYRPVPSEYCSWPMAFNCKQFVALVPSLPRSLRSLKPLHADLTPHMTLVVTHYLGSTRWMHSLGRRCSCHEHLTAWAFLF